MSNETLVDYLRGLPSRGDNPDTVNAVVEIPKGRRSKFEFDKDLKVFKLDRFLYSSLHYPGEYGFVPQTLAGDGDPLDIVVMVNEPTFSGCLIEARVLGLFKMHDKGEEDFKLLAVPEKDPLFHEFRSLDDVPKHFLREFEHFFETYKQLEGRKTEVFGWEPREAAFAELEASIRRFKK